MISHSHRKPCTPKCGLDGAQLQNVEIVDVGISIGIDIACSAADDRDVELEAAHGFESRRYVQAGPCAAPFQANFYRRAPTGWPAFNARNRPVTLLQTAAARWLHIMISGDYRASFQLDWRNWWSNRIAPALQLC